MFKYMIYIYILYRVVDQALFKDLSKISQGVAKLALKSVIQSLVNKEFNQFKIPDSNRIIVGLSGR